MTKVRDYEALVAASLRPVPTLTDAEEILKNDKRKIKYPERRAIELEKSLEMQQFRDAKQDETDEERRHRNATERTSRRPPASLCRPPSSCRPLASRSGAQPRPSSSTPET